MEKQVKVSVIIPVYQAEQYLAETLESILGQSYGDFEVIIVDDGSRDRSCEIYGAYAQKDARVRIVKQENAGPSAARNNGIANARGEYIAFLDSDDVMNPDALQAMVCAMEEEQTELVIGMYALWKEESDWQQARAWCHLFPQERVCVSQADVANLFGRPRTSLLGVSVWGKLYKRSIIQAYNVRFPLDMHYEEDCCFNLQYYAHIQTAAVLYMTVNYYRIRADSLSKAYNVKQFPFLINGYQKRKAFARSLGMQTLEKQIDEVFFVVTIAQLKKVARSAMSGKDKRSAYRHILSHDEAQYVLKHEGQDAGVISRLIAKLALRGNIRLIELLLEIWKCKVVVANCVRNLKWRMCTALSSSNGANELVEQADEEE